MKKSPLTLALLLSISPVAFAHNVAEDIAENVEKSNVKKYKHGFTTKTHKLTSNKLTT